MPVRIQIRRIRNRALSLRFLALLRRRCKRAALLRPLRRTVAASISLHLS
mgnify:CR=1 FL=1